MRHFFVLILFLTTSILSCNNEGDEFFEKDKADILFVGNSLTFANDMPQMVIEIAADLGMEIKVQVYAYPNAGLEDHWKEGIVRNLLRDREFGYVVFQQGPSSQADGRSSLIEYGGHIADYARSQNVTPVFYMVWPALQYYGTFNGVIENYSYAASETSSLLAPVGELWQIYRGRQNTLELYGQDDFHPSNAGSFLAALTIFHAVYPEADIDKLSYDSFRAFVSQEYAFEEIKTLVGEN